MRLDLFRTNKEEAEMLPSKSLPRKEEWLIQVVLNSDNQIIICNAVNMRPRKLPIYQDSLQHISHCF